MIEQVCGSTEEMSALIAKINHAAFSPSKLSKVLDKIVNQFRPNI